MEKRMSSKEITQVRGGTIVKHSLSECLWSTDGSQNLQFIRDDVRLYIDEQVADRQDPHRSNKQCTRDDENAVAEGDVKQTVYFDPRLAAGENRLQVEHVLGHDSFAGRDTTDDLRIAVDRHALLNLSMPRTWWERSVGPAPSSASTAAGRRAASGAHRVTTALAPAVRAAPCVRVDSETFNRRSSRLSKLKVCSVRFCWRCTTVVRARTCDCHRPNGGKREVSAAHA
jgi:hypothetical protein